MIEYEKTKQQAEIDQGAALIIDSFPMLWYGLYSACVKEGFSESEAMETLKTYITASCSPFRGNSD